jgi:nicotinamidase-related amidase/type 1 glutamine amidotransferase
MNARMKTCCLLGVAVALNLPSHSLAGGADSKTEQTKDSFRLELRQRTASTSGLTQVVLANDTFDPRTTAVVVIDMWDRHWCRTYTARVAELVPRMNATIAAARQLGLQIVWAPSDVLDFYADHPRRKAMLAIPEHPTPAKIAFNPPQVPQGDFCECGPDHGCKSAKVWTRQQADLLIADTDLIADCNNGRELLNLCAERGIKTLIYLGVASNMCVCYRSAGMINLRAHGLRTIFVRDQVQAIMANGINPAARKPDANFTPAKGSAIVERFLEQHVAPSVESRQLLAAAGVLAYGNDPRPHLVFVLADEEYETGETLPAFAERKLRSSFRCTFLHANPADRNDVPGLSALYDADLLVLSMHRRFLPVTQMDHLERFIRAGKPLVTIGDSITPFAEGADLKRSGDGLVVWQDFDREILGCRYNYDDAEAGHSGSDVWVVAEAKKSPVLRGLDGLRFHSSSRIYRLNPLADDTTVLLRARWSGVQPEEPVAWTRVSCDGGRIFYTSLGHPDDFRLEGFQTLLLNAINWALQRETDKL